MSTTDSQRSAENLRRLPRNLQASLVRHERAGLRSQPLAGGLLELLPAHPLDADPHRTACASATTCGLGVASLSLFVILRRHRHPADGLLQAIGRRWPTTA